jgi:rhodanese-related sulfurtransferase
MVAHPGVDVILSGIVEPIFPRDGPSVVVHCRSGNRCPRSVKITLDQRAEGGWTLVQGSV